MSSQPAWPKPVRRRGVPDLWIIIKRIRARKWASRAFFNGLQPTPFRDWNEHDDSVRKRRLARQRELDVDAAHPIDEPLEYIQAAADPDLDFDEVCSRIIE